MKFSNDTTEGSPVKTTRLNLKDRSRHFGGQMSDETVQKAIVNITQLDITYIKYHFQDPSFVVSTELSDARRDRSFHDRFGPGYVLASKGAD